VSEYLEATLGSLSVGLKLWNEVDLGTVTYEDEETANIYADINTQLARRSGKLRQQHYTIRLRGSDKDDLITQENALRTELGKEVNTMVVRPKNATLAQTWVVRRNPATTAPLDVHYEKANIAYCDVVLVCEPWGYGEAIVIYAAASFTSPAVVSLYSPLVGQGDPRLRLKVTRNWSGAGVGMQFVCVALCVADTTAADYVYQAEASDLSGFWYDYSGNANCAGGHAARLDAADSTAWEYCGTVVPAGGPPVGRYRVMVRARATTGDEGYLAKRKQYSTDRDPSTTVTLNHDVLAWHDLGEWVHYGSDPLRLWGKAVTGGIYVDQVVLVPVDFGLVWYSDPAEDTHLVRFGWLYDHKFTTTGAPTVELDATGRLQGHGLKAPREGFDLFVFVEPNGSNPAPSVKLDATYLPRWEMFR
jgi:hypothetical protein